MKTIFCTFIAIASLFCAGCAPSEMDDKPKSESEYRKLLEKRISSAGGAVININQEVNEYRKASPDEKREMYRKVYELVN